MTKHFDTELFISEIQKRRSIWDSEYTHADNQGKELKKRDWDEIIDIFGGSNMSATDRHVLGFTLRKRWKNIRTCFARELKRKRNYGSGASRKSEYMYYRQLLFLTNVMNISEKDMVEGPEYVYYEDNDMDLSETNFRVNKLKRRISDDDSYSDKEDEDRLFLLSLHRTMKRIPRNKKIAVKIKMLSILNNVVSDDENNE